MFCSLLTSRIADGPGRTGVFGLALVVSLVTLQTPEKSVANVAINNGLAPPNPTNATDASSSFRNDSVFVQNVGCDAAVLFESVSPGADTTVERIAGGGVGDPSSRHPMTVAEGVARCFSTP